MDHRRTEHDSILERYLLRQLSGEEEARFEEHLLDCSRCRSELDAAEDFQRSLRFAVAERTAGTAAALGLAGWLRRHRGALAGALALALPLAYLLWRGEDLAREIDRLRPAASPPAVAELEQSVQALEGELRRAETELAGERRERAAEIEGQGRRITELAARVAALVAPQVQTTVAYLAAARSTGDEPPVNRIRRPADAGWWVLVVELAVVEHEAYRAELRDAGGRRLWEHRGLRPDALGTLTVSFHSSFLPPADYVLELWGIGGAAEAPVGRYPFRVF